VKSFLSPMGPMGGADLHSYSRQPDTSLHCEVTDMGPAYRAACPFTPYYQLK